MEIHLCIINAARNQILDRDTAARGIQDGKSIIPLKGLKLKEMQEYEIPKDDSNGIS